MAKHTLHTLLLPTSSVCSNLLLLRITDFFNRHVCYAMPKRRWPYSSVCHPIFKDPHAKLFRSVRPYKSVEEGKVFFFFFKKMWMLRTHICGTVSSQKLPHHSRSKCKSERQRDNTTVDHFELLRVLSLICKTHACGFARKKK